MAIKFASKQSHYKQLFYNPIKGRDGLWCRRQLRWVAGGGLFTAGSRQKAAAAVIT
jgi:hypothetical protein